MIVDPETFEELAARLEHVSRGVLRTAQHFAAVSTERQDDDELGTLTDQLMGIVMELIVIDKLVTAVQEANQAEGVLPPAPVGR